MRSSSSRAWTSYRSVYTTSTWSVLHSTQRKMSVTQRHSTAELWPLSRHAGLPGADLGNYLHGVRPYLAAGDGASSVRGNWGGPRDPPLDVQRPLPGSGAAPANDLPGAPGQSAAGPAALEGLEIGRQSPA